MDDDLETELKKLSNSPSQSTENKIFEYSDEYSTLYILKISGIIKNFQININNLYCDGNQIKFCNDYKDIKDENYIKNLDFIKKTIYNLYRLNKDNITITELYSIIKTNITTINFIYFLFNDLCFDILKIIKSYEILLNRIKDIEYDEAVKFLLEKISDLSPTFKEENNSKLELIKKKYKNIIIPINYFKILSYFKDDLIIFIGQDKSKLYNKIHGNRANPNPKEFLIYDNTKFALEEFLKINSIGSYYTPTAYRIYIWPSNKKNNHFVKNIINKFLENIENLDLDLDENIKFEYNYFPLLFDELKKYRALLSIINNIICGKIEFLMSILNNNKTIKLKPFIITESHIVNISNEDTILYTKKELVDNPQFIY